MRSIRSGSKQTFASLAGGNDECVNGRVGQARAPGCAATEVSNFRVLCVAGLIVICAVGERVLVRASSVRVCKRQDVAGLVSGVQSRRTVVGAAELTVEHRVLSVAVKVRARNRLS
jgi:hypothetical protein